MSNTWDQSPHFTIRGYGKPTANPPSFLTTSTPLLSVKAFLPAARQKPQDRRHVPILTTYMLGFKADKTARFRGLRVFNDEALMSFGQMISRRLKARAAQSFPLP
jgi:hypothetical protein